MKLPLLFIATALMSVIGHSCSSETPATPEVSFIAKTTGEANFYKLEADPALDPARLQWVFAGGEIVKARSSVIHYFGSKGAHEVTLRYTAADGKTYEHTGTVDVTSDSVYELRGETLWWSDEFDGDKIDTSYWNYDTGSNKNENLWGNNEWQNYTNSSENSFLRDGCLVIKAIRSGEGQKVADYTSARLTTKGKREINRGRVEVRAKLGGGVGLWPAIWMYASSWTDGMYSELDIMEYVGCDKNIIYSAVHTNYTKSASANAVSDNRTIAGVEDNFHIYGINWTDGKVEFYVDDHTSPHLVFSVDDTADTNKWPFNKSLYVILNVAVGGDWGGMRGVDDSIFPQEMEVDYVRIFKLK